MPRKISEEEKATVRKFCVALREWRRDLNLTQGALARLIGTSPSWVSMVEKAEILPNFTMRQRLRLALEEEEFKRAARRIKRNKNEAEIQAVR